MAGAKIEVSSRRKEALYMPLQQEISAIMQQQSLK
jgi:hypothetical protein